jgi:hypothetical protein
MNEQQGIQRTWPFEKRGEPRQPYHTPADFVRRRGRGVTGVVVRIGLHDAQLVLVDEAGAWDRWVFESVDEARAVSEALGVATEVGRYPEQTRLRMNARVRSREDFHEGAYPEQGRVGPVIPYAENRPRPIEDQEQG